MATNPGDLPLTLLPTAALPLSGTELLYVVQGGKDKSTAFGIVSRTDGIHDFTGDHKWQLIFANGKTYRYFDGVLFNVKMFNWGGQAPLQIACNLACGSLEAAYGSNTLSPNNSNNFTGMVLGVKSIKVWYQEAP